MTENTLNSPLTIGRRLALTAATAALALFALGSSDGSKSGTLVHKGQKGEISYAHGGVGKNSMAEIKKIDDDFDLKVVFVDAGDRYLANVNVEIASLDGKHEMKLTTKGPVFLANLPNGEYRLRANMPGRSIAKQTFTSRDDDRTWLTMKLPSKKKKS